MIVGYQITKIQTHGLSIYFSSHLLQVVNSQKKSQESEFRIICILWPQKELSWGFCLCFETCSADNLSTKIQSISWSLIAHGIHRKRSLEQSVPLGSPDTQTASMEDWVEEAWSSRPGSADSESESLFPPLCVHTLLWSFQPIWAPRRHWRVLEGEAWGWLKGLDWKRNEQIAKLGIEGSSIFKRFPSNGTN